MTFSRLLLRNLFYHWRGNIAVLMGVVVGAAVLTGALLVGDSLRGSLRDLTLERLGWVEVALVPGRIFREELATGLNADRVSPALILQGSAFFAPLENANPVARSPRVILYGVDERFWPVDQLPVGPAFWKPADLAAPGERGVVLGAPLARDLGVREGQSVTLNLPRVSRAPRETFLGRRKTEDVVAALRFKVAAVLPEDHLGSKFSLNPGSFEPRNAFVPLGVLQRELRLQEPTLPEHPVNALLVRGAKADDLQGKLRRDLQLEDLGLVLRQPRRRPGGATSGYLSLESRELFLSERVKEAVGHAGLVARPTLVYLVNNLAEGKRQLATAAALLAPPGPVPLLQPVVAYYGPLELPYLIVAGLEAGAPPPLGPFLPQQFLDKGIHRLGKDQILLVRYPGSPLDKAKTGDELTLTYYLSEEGRLQEETAGFKLAAIIPLAGAADDPNLTPQFPGITDRLTLDAWDPPFPFDRSRIGPADEEFWTKHRTTPKAYINLKTAKKLWGSRFGEYTSLRIATLGLSKEVIERKILANLPIQQMGMVFRAVRGRGLEASAGGTDFGMLFLVFSIFLIAAALLLVGLLFRLNLDRRAAEVGLFLATGFRRGKVGLLLLAEGGLLALAGAAIGCAGALVYADLLLRFLGASWPGGLDQAFLHLHGTSFSFVVGYSASVVISLLTIVWATRILTRVPPSGLLAGTTVANRQDAGASRQSRSSLWLAALAGVGAVASLAVGFAAKGHEAQAGSFFGSGALVLIALLALVWARLKSATRRHVRVAPGLVALGARNASRHPLRSLLTVGLLAAATFLVVAVQAFHRDLGRDFQTRTGGSGGFSLLAEAELAIYEDLNNARAREELEMSEEARLALRGAHFVPLRLSSGDDASCLNLYRPLRPRLLGVPGLLIARGGFHFAATEASTPEERQNPWLLLRKPQPNGAIPVFGEANTVQWMLHSGLGKDIKVPDERGNQVPLRIVGLFEDSVFQSELVTSEQHFLALFPRQEGYRMFLIEAAPAEADRIKTALENGLASYGLAVTPTAQRLASFLAVENTYLATFQALGGLGVLLGALGLAVVLLRSVWERRGELALLRAVGFRRSALGWLVLAENAWLLALGLGVGTAAALLTVAPHMAGGADLALWLRLLGLLALVLFVGLAAGAGAVAATLRAPLLPALRRE
jgi:ABC-type lipoprotein release transport system permease subunit